MGQTTPSLKPVPGPAGLPLLGVLPRMARDPIQLFMDAAREYGGLARLRLGPATSYLVTHPDLVKHVMQDHHRNYIRGDSVRIARRLLGNGIALSDGDSWLRQRRLMQPAFHRQRLAQMSRPVTAVIARQLDGWQAAAAQARPLDLVPEMMRLTLTAVVRAVFSSEAGGELETLITAFNIAQADMIRRTTSLFEWPDWLPTPGNTRYRRAIAALDAAVHRLIDAGRRDPRDDLLGMLLAARDEATGQGMNDQQLRDEVMTLLFAGHETTATALAWTWHVLMQHPQVETRARAEVDEALGGRTPTFDDLPRLAYLSMVLHEAMRLYTPIWILARQSVAADEMGGYPIPANALIMLSPYVTHHDPGLWPDPERFDPERFSPEQAAARPRHAYWPFGTGPHLCIGNNFALMEAQLALAMTLQRYRLRPVVDAPPRRLALVTLRPAELKVRLERLA